MAFKETKAELTAREAAEAAEGASVPAVAPVHPHAEAMALNVVKLNGEVAALKAQMSALWKALGGATRVE